ncbi:hypothetical protein KC325_g172 [Hortaea werneckii]|nr:hypothetical protein KC325_g172 [Hortaea werneckii]
MDSGAVVFRAERNTNTELDAERYVGENAARLRKTCQHELGCGPQELQKKKKKRTDDSKGMFEMLAFRYGSPNCSKLHVDEVMGKGKDVDGEVSRRREERESSTVESCLPRAHPGLKMSDLNGVTMLRRSLSLLSRA